MNNANIRRYERELTGNLRGARLRKRVSAAFAQSLAPLLEEVPDPSYEDLADAFGPPELFAQSLLQTIEIPQPVPLWKKLVLGLCAVLAVCVVGFGAFSLWNVPEEGTLCSDAALYTGYIDMHNHFAVDDPLTHGDSHWDQPRDMAAYQVEIHNTNSVRTNVFIRYSEYQPPHTFVVPAGETRVFVVNDPRPGPHSIAFNTPDGTLDGAVRVLLSDTPIA